jgi:hypothetical protein
LTGIYDDRILSFTNDWINTNDLVRRVKGDKTKIIPACKELVELGYLDMKTDGYVKRYKRLDKAQSQKQFDHLIELFESNKLIAIDEINEMKTIVTKKGILTRRGEALLDWIQSELIDRSFMVMTRLKYQDTLKLLPHSIVNKRLQRIDEFVNSVMKCLAPLKQEKLILERFQNHTHKLEPFKI